MACNTEAEEVLIDDSPPPINPYEVLGLDVQASADQVKSAYRKQALKHHPDKATPETKDEAHAKFQEIAFAYAILSDSRRRTRYDATGNTSESLDIDDDDFNWTDFFRAQKAEMVDGEAIQRIKGEYQHSEQERTDLIAAFEQCQGDMDAVYEEIMCSNVLEDDERFRQIIDDAIDKNEATAWKKYKKETVSQRQKRVKRARKEETEAREYAEELGVADKLFGKKKTTGKKKDDISDLAALIQQRQKGREDAFLDSLEVRYGERKPTKGRKRPPVTEPPEEAFEKNRKKKARA
ncbi:hypothetical protein EPUS_03713 [Endocarpon pusillum Z07020]|uniref:J domain-containing protein n=1 Tax=Endocarpon pusillum (strain Z07020 / HMAS-L-300199) TaxID=1263415 RepID=U1HEB0_ENDPU|nr:uncharacterized protein EPUS_03713 [Endocarpon pusillum Z07020]ERF68395.1 hypothetical protein EPUS_03713 [Endocarpon pusillum Z07020]